MNLKPKVIFNFRNNMNGSWNALVCCFSVTFDSLSVIRKWNLSLQFCFTIPTTRYFVYILIYVICSCMRFEVIQTEEREALRKQGLNEKTAASVLLKLFISGNEGCYTTDHTPQDDGNTRYGECTCTCVTVVRRQLLIWSKIWQRILRRHDIQDKII